MSARRSASGEGARFFSFNFARMKASIGFPVAEGGRGFNKGLSDHWGLTSFADPANSSGHDGPASIQSRNVFTSTAVKRGVSLFLGGIVMSSSSPLTKRMSG